MYFVNLKMMFAEELVRVLKKEEIPLTLQPGWFSEDDERWRFEIRKSSEVMYFTCLGVICAMRRSWTVARIQLPGFISLNN